jgi:hypothetical protein
MATGFKNQTIDLAQKASLGFAGSVILSGTTPTWPNDGA